jgi:hypothetical protein
MLASDTHSPRGDKKRDGALRSAAYFLRLHIEIAGDRLSRRGESLAVDVFHDARWRALFHMLRGRR